MLANLEEEDGEPKLTIEESQQILAGLTTEKETLEAQFQTTQKENEELRELIDSTKETSVLSEREVYEVTRAKLASAYASLTTQHQKFQEYNKESLTRIQTLQNQVLHKNQEHLATVELHQAHEAQKEFRKQLKMELAGANIYKMAIARMESTIEALERIEMDKDLLQGKSLIDSPALLMLEEENSRLDAEITKLEGIHFSKLGVLLNTDDRYALELEELRRMEEEANQLEIKLLEMAIEQAENGKLPPRLMISK